MLKRSHSKVSRGGGHSLKPPYTRLFKYYKNLCHPEKSEGSHPKQIINKILRLKPLNDRCALIKRSENDVVISSLISDQNCNNVITTHSANARNDNAVGRHDKAFLRFCRHSVQKNDRKKCAFTLAEVLITLAIIGVVVAMTIPSLMYRHKQITTVNKVKNFYSKMNNLMVHVIQNNAELKYLTWTDSATNPELSAKEFWTYFKPYISVAKDCGINKESDCFPSSVYKLSGGLYSNFATWNGYRVKLKDGGSLIIGIYDGHCVAAASNTTTNICAYIFYDVNGLKAPNTLGRDIFHFYILSNEIIPCPIDFHCNINSEGYGCADYILQHDSMDYLK